MLLPLELDRIRTNPRNLQARRSIAFSKLFSYICELYVIVSHVDMAYSHDDVC